MKCSFKCDLFIIYLQNFALIQAELFTLYWTAIIVSQFVYRIGAEPREPCDRTTSARVGRFGEDGKIRTEILYPKS